MEIDYGPRFKMVLEDWGSRNSIMGKCIKTGFY